MPRVSRPVRPSVARAASRRRVAVAAAVVAIGGLTVLTWHAVAGLQASSGVDGEDAGADAIAARPSAGAASPAFDPSGLPPPAAGPHRPPGDVTEDQWRAIQDRIEAGPSHDRELARIADLLEYQRHVARLRLLRGDPSPAAAEERRALARAIDAGLDLHLSRRETTGPEAVLLKTAVLEELEPDAAQRAARLEAWKHAWIESHPSTPDPRVAEYQRQEAAIVADWQARPAPRRDPVELARRLQQVQVAVFNTGP